MNEQGAAVAGVEPGDESPQDFEQRLPAGQRWFNGFCENWIFAFVVAMALRQFFIEAYRIPTASMEPTLYGDIALTKADHVVVSKMGYRFSSPDRWGVAVFQYPVPEVQGPRGGEIKAVTPDGERLDSFPFRPLLQRNFVKRVVAMPGDTFYIANGDIQLQQEDGSFGPLLKPEHIQEALWLPIYSHSSSDYVPWRASSQGRSAVTAVDGQRLRFDLADDPGVLFTQPLINLYVKPGPVNVRPQRGSDQGWQQEDVSLLEPLFTYGGRQGNIFDLQNWQVRRVTTADLDSAHYGASLNERMRDHVGDVRWTLVPEELAGEVALGISQGELNALRWSLTEDGWQVSLDDVELASGTGSLQGRRLQLALVDDRARAWLDGEELFDPRAITPVDPAASHGRTRLTLRGSGSLVAREVAVDRDVHYIHDGVMRDDRGNWGRRLPATASAQEVAAVESQQAQILETRRQFIPHLADPQLRQQLLESMERRDRGDSAWLQPLGVSAETAITVPDQAYLMLGDNSPFSLDSRTWGWVPAVNIRGRVMAVVMPRWKRVR